MKRIAGSKLNNMGFSLVEVLVAMTVLALVIAPLAALFTSSVHMNIVSKRRMNALTFAEDLMESIKANDIGEISFQFNNPSSFKLIDPEVVDGATLAETSTDPGTFTYDINDEGDIVGYKFKPNSTGLYEFSLDDVHVQKGYEAYGATVKIDANPTYVNSSGATVAKYTKTDAEGEASSKIDYNKAKLVEVATIKNDANMSGMRSGSVDSDVYTELIGEAALAGYTITESNVKRVFTIDIDDEDTASMSVQYTADHTSGKSSSLNNFDSGATDSHAKLKNIFLFYTPNYYSTATNRLDTIQINNSNGIPVNVYIVKQENYDYTGFANDEKNYRVNINVMDVSASDPQTRVLTNIGYNLAHEYDDSVVEEIAGQGTYKIKQGLAGLQITVGEGSALYSQLVHDLSDTTVKDRFYDVEIQVYRAEDPTDIIYTLTGSTQE